MSARGRWSSQDDDVCTAPQRLTTSFPLIPGRLILFGSSLPPDLHVQLLQLLYSYYRLLVAAMDSRVFRAIYIGQKRGPYVELFMLTVPSLRGSRETASYHAKLCSFFAFYY